MNLKNPNTSAQKSQVSTTDKQTGGLRGTRATVIGASASLWVIALFLPAYWNEALMSVNAYGWGAFVEGGFIWAHLPQALFEGFTDFTINDWSVLGGWTANIFGYVALILILYRKYNMATIYAAVGAALSFLAIFVNDATFDTKAPVSPLIGVYVWITSLVVLFIGTVILYRQERNAKS